MSRLSFRRPSEGALEAAALAALEEGLAFTGFQGSFQSLAGANPLKDDGKGAAAGKRGSDIFCAGDLCETQHWVTMRAEESLESNIIGEYPEGLAIVIVETGFGRRVRVRMLETNLVGWISFKTKGDIMLIEKQAQRNKYVAKLLGW
jgi:hypothetical protein